MATLGPVSAARFDALKRKAKRLRREKPEIKHAQALDEVARDNGFQSWAALAAARTGTASNRSTAEEEPEYREAPKTMAPGCRHRRGMRREPCEDCGSDACRCLPDEAASLFDSHDDEV